MILDKEEELALIVIKLGGSEILKKLEGKVGRNNEMVKYRKKTAQKFRMLLRFSGN